MNKLIRKTERIEYDYTWATFCDTCGEKMREVTFSSPTPPVDSICVPCLKAKFAAFEAAKIETPT